MKIPRLSSRGFFVKQNFIKISWFLCQNLYIIVALPETVGSQFNKDVSSHLGYIKNMIFVMTNLWVVFF